GTHLGVPGVGRALRQRPDAAGARRYRQAAAARYALKLTPPVLNGGAPDTGFFTVNTGARDTPLWLPPAGSAAAPLPPRGAPCVKRAAADAPPASVAGAAPRLTAGQDNAGAASRRAPAARTPGT